MYIAKKAVEQETGARGLRAIVESFMTNIMYDIPSSTNIEKLIITKECILENKAPESIYKENRVPTVRESARIQSFPDDYFFTNSKTSQYTQVGNAVPPIMAKAIAEKIDNVLRNKKEKCLKNENIIRNKKK